MKEKRERKTHVRTLSLFSFKKDHTLEFFFFLKGLTLGLKERRRKTHVKKEL